MQKMPFEWENIQNEWLLRQAISYEPEEILEAFNTVERICGAEWFVSKFRGARGPFVCISIVDLGKTLKEIEKIPNAGKILQKIKDDKSDIFQVARIAAYYLSHKLQVEFEPELLVQGNRKHPDLRIKWRDSWIYVEVAKASLSKHQEQINKIMSKLSEVIKKIKAGLHLEIYLFKEPSEKEVDQIIQHCKSLCDAPEQPQELNLKDLAQIFANPIGQERLSKFDSALKEKRPVLVYVYGELQSGKRRQCTVKFPFTDERAERILRREYRQLSKKEVGLIVLDISNIPGSLKAWSELISRRLQPNLHRRIGAVLLVKHAISIKSLEIQKSLVAHPNPYKAVPEEFIKLTNAYS
jgi:hypothetical protein